MNFLRRFLQLFNRRERFRLGLLGVMLLFASLFEVVSIGIVLPFLKIIGEPGLVLDNERFGPLLRHVGLTTPKAVIIGACVLTLGLFVVKGFYVAMTWRLFYAFLIRKMISLSKQLLQAYLKTSYLFHLRRNTADLIRNTTTEVENIAGILKYAMVLPTEILVVIGLVTVLLVTQPAAALGGFLVLGPVAWALTSLTRKRISSMGRIRSEQHGRMIQSVNQGLGGVKEIKLLGCEDHFVQLLGESGARYGESLRKSSLLQQYPRLVIETTAAAVLVGLVLFLLLTHGSLDNLLPVITLFGIAVVRLVPSVSRILTSLNQIRFLAPAVGVVQKDIREAAAIADPPRQSDSSQPVTFHEKLELHDLAYRYPETTESALAGVTLTVQRGQKVAFVGTSGAGKTTLVNLVLGLLKPSSGQILVDGRDIWENLPSWQSDLGYIPQDIYLLDDTIRRNVAFGLPDAAINDAAIWGALESAQLAGFVRELEGGLDALVGERGARISAGQRQRIGIARALYHDPDVLVLDEATSALDNETERQFAAAINNLSRSKTVLIIAHRLTTVRHCDIIFVLDGGRLAGAGTYDDLRISNPVFNQLVSAVNEPVPA